MQHDHSQHNDLSGRVSEDNIDHHSSPSMVNQGAANNPNPISMTLIPWKDIWSSLRIAKIRGNGEMIEVFYDTLFKEAIFDDKGAWSWDPNKRTPNS
jgi:hypothetical protein